MVSGTHTIPIRIPKDSLPQGGVPLLGVPGITLDFLPHRNSRVPLEGCNCSISGSMCCFDTCNWTEAGTRVEDWEFLASNGSSMFKLK